MINLELEEYVKDWKYYLGKEGRGYSYRWILEEILQKLSKRPEINVIEFGGGCSSKHISSYPNVKRHVIIESKEKYYNAWKENFPSCEVYFSPLLYDLVENFSKKSFDLIFLDGNTYINKAYHEGKRIDCLLVSSVLLKDDGYAIYHDAHRHPKKLLEKMTENGLELIKKHFEPALSKVIPITVETWLIRKKQQNI